MSARLGLHVWFAGADKGIYPLGERTSVGRGLAGWADICVDEPLISGGKHLVIHWDADSQSHRLIDLGHPNRICVNGVPVERSGTLLLHEGDEIRIGQSIFRCEPLRD